MTTIIQAMEDDEAFGRWFEGDSWDVLATSTQFLSARAQAALRTPRLQTFIPKHRGASDT